MEARTSSLVIGYSSELGMVWQESSGDLVFRNILLITVSGGILGCFGR